MKIVVCIKQVPDAKTVRFDREKGTLIREGVEAVINPYDLHALEAALTLKDSVGGEVTVITMGPPPAETALRDTIALGADNTVLLCDRAFAGSDTLATTYVLAKAIEKIGAVDLVLCGKLTTDGDTAQVGPGLAERLGLPYVTCVGELSLAENGTTLRAKRMFEDRFDIVEVKLPALLTVLSTLNNIRVPSLKGKMRAKKAEVPVWSADDLGVEKEKIGLSGSPTKVSETWVPSFKTKKEMLTGPAKEQVEKLVTIFKQAGII